MWEEASQWPQDELKECNLLEQLEGETLEDLEEEPLSMLKDWAGDAGLIGILKGHLLGDLGRVGLLLCNSII